MLKAAVIGLGYWGPNLVRNLSTADGVDLVAVCDLKESRCEVVARSYPGVRMSVDSGKVLADGDVDAVVVATPTHTHYPLAKKALEAGKHVWVEKPITDDVAQAEELVDLADRKGLVLMVDHTFVYHPAVEKISEVIKNGELGDIYYYDSVRINLGLFQPDVSVLWDLASHDVSIMDHLIPQAAMSVQAAGACHAGAEVESMAYVTVQHDGGALGHCHVNWLAPTKIRLVMIGGSRRMVVYDDNNVSEKVKIFDKGVDIKTVEGCYEAMIQYRTGDMYAPALDRGEALKRETHHFIECITHDSQPLTDGRAGLRVVRILAAAQKSIDEQGQMIPL